MRAILGILLLYANLIAGKPQHGFIRPSKNCQTGIVYEEVVENVCENIMREQCDTIQVRKCLPGQKQTCQMVNKQKCETVTKKVCNDSWKEIRQNLPFTSGFGGQFGGGAKSPVVSFRAGPGRVGTETKDCYRPCS